MIGFDSVIRWGSAIAVAALLVTLGVTRDELQRERIARRDDQLRVAQRILDAVQHNEGIAQEIAALRRDIRTDTRNITTEIANAPESDDGALSPVMLLALDRLRTLYAQRVAPAADRASSVSGSADTPAREHPDGAPVSAVANP